MNPNLRRKLELRRAREHAARMKEQINAAAEHAESKQKEIERAAMLRRMSANFLFGK